MPDKFITGLDLSEHFYHEAVKPILEVAFPDLVHSSALLGHGSEVLGFDTQQSTDHDWGPRLYLFLMEPDLEIHQDAVDQALRQGLPAEFYGYPTSFGENPDGTTVMARNDDGLVNHQVKIVAVGQFFENLLKFDPTGEIKVVDWVSVPEYHLLMLTSGRVFYDGLDQVELLRKKLRYYPDQVWFYRLAVQWQRISQEEHFLGRSGQVGDDLGSRLIAARLVRDLMRLCFLVERKYAPYIKWFGSAFAKLESAAVLMPVFDKVLKSETWQERQDHLNIAYEYIAGLHNELKITPPMDVSVSPFFSRPFRVINAGRFVDAIRAQIKDEAVLALPKHLGAFDQYVDSTDALVYFDKLKEVYR